MHNVTCTYLLMPHFQTFLRGLLHESSSCPHQTPEISSLLIISISSWNHVKQEDVARKSVKNNDIIIWAYDA
jgi:hypothetical protein